MTDFPPLRRLMGPGPSDVSPRVLAALARPTVGHLDPVFQILMENIKEKLRLVLKTDNALTIPVSAPGSAAMEMCLVNLLEPGDKIIIAQNGVFGGRMADICGRIGAEAVVLQHDWGTPCDPDRVEAALKDAGQVKALAFVHAETSTGARSDAATLCKLAHDHGALAIVDAVTSVGGIDVDVDDWGIDALYTGTQKCLSAPPGLAPVTLSDRAAETVRNRKTKVVSWFLDLNLVMDYWDGAGGRSYHHTAPVNALYGLDEALTILLEEGLDASFARHRHLHSALVAGLEAMGLSMLVDPDYRLPQLNTVRVPDGVDEAAVRKMALDRFSLEIGAGLGPLAGKVWRIGLMGTSARLDNVTTCLTAIEDALAAQQVKLTRGAAVEAALAVG